MITLPALSHHLKYILLQGIAEASQGHVRLEASAEALEMSIHAQGCPADIPLRLLLLSCDEDGAALDLGPVQPSADGVVQAQRSMPLTELPLWDAIGLAEDWPSGRLAAVGWLTDPPGPMWRLMDAAAQFLRVPAAQSP